MSLTPCISRDVCWTRGAELEPSARGAGTSTCARSATPRCSGLLYRPLRVCEVARGCGLSFLRGLEGEAVPTRREPEAGTLARLLPGAAVRCHVLGDLSGTDGHSLRYSSIPSLPSLPFPSLPSSAWSPWSSIASSRKLEMG